MKNYTLLLILLSQTLFAANTILTVGPTSDFDCQFSSIQAAVNSGQMNMDIRVSNQLSTNTGVNINGVSVRRISGGYDSCANAGTGTVNNLVPTTISNMAGTALSVNETRAAVSTSIDVSGFDLVNSTIGLSAGSGANTTAFIVNVDNVNISNNTQGMVVNVGTADVTTVNFNNSSIHDNTTVNDGGGIFCVQASIHLGNVVSVFNNNATNGGGVYARSCNISLQSGDNQQINNVAFGIFKNTASGNGGGIYLSQSQLTTTGNSVFLASISFNNAPSITSFNVGHGGGLYVGSGSTVDLNHTRIYGNTASQRGGGIYMEHDNINTMAPLLTMKRDANTCTIGSSHVCSILSFNKVSQDDGQGGAVFLNSEAHANIYQTEINNNEATDAAAFYLLQNAALELEGDLIINNRLKDVMIAPQNSSIIFAKSLTNININFTTFADNFVSNLFRVEASNIFTLNNTIISHTGEVFATFGSINYNGVVVNCSLYNGHSNPFHATFFAANSFFNNTIGFNNINDYSLSAASPAIDVACSNLASAQFSDIVAYDRLTDGVADLGAYEKQATVFAEEIFINGFEGL